MSVTPLAAAITALVAGAVASVSGFGIGSVLTPLFLLAFPAPVAVALVAIPHALATAVRWWGLRGDVDRSIFRGFGVASAAGGLAGAALQPVLGGAGLTAVLALLLLLAGGSELLGRRLPLPRTRLARLAGGGISGVFGGLVGNQGGIRSAALLSFRLTPRALVATGTAAALLVDAARLPVYLVRSGPALAAHLPLVAAATVGALLGTVIGVPVLGRIPARAYRVLLGSLLVLLGAGLLIGAWRSLQRARPVLAAGPVTAYDGATSRGDAASQGES